MNTTQEVTLDELLKMSIEEKIEDTIPNFRTKNKITKQQIEDIIKTISRSLKIPDNKVLIGMMLLFLQGAASAGAPVTMSVDLGDGKCLEKRNIMLACATIAGHSYIRRIAEALAIEIGQFAENNRLAGELAYRINTKVKATGDIPLNEKELAYCSSFSQCIPELEKYSSERLVQLLSEDYQKRFENKKKPLKNDNTKLPVEKTKKKKKKK